MQTSPPIEWPTSSTGPRDAASITASSIELCLLYEADGGRGLPDVAVDKLNANVTAARWTGAIASSVFLLTAIGGIVEANLSFVPEFREGVRQRTAPAAPPQPSVTPVVGAIPGAAHVGVFGHF